MKKLKFQRPSGMHDITPYDFKYYKSVFNRVEEIADFYNFGRIETPILESEELFLKGVGSNTDVTQKEMFTLKTKGGDVLALRPEGTASVVRSYVENGMMNRPQPVKLYYIGPFFRHERPQAGRFRQFWQYGFEIIGEDCPVIDAQTIQINYEILKEIGLKDISIEINSIGDKECRPVYRRALIKYLKSKTSSLCPDCKKRMKENPLRVLDCKNEKCNEIKREAPQMMDYFCLECRDHFKKVLEYLDELDIPYQLNPYLVRGLDYYTKTVFEFFVSNSEQKSLALGGGGRYDDLIKALGGKETPAVGSAFGVERVITAMKEQGISETKRAKEKVFLAQISDMGKRKSLKIIEDLRKAKIPTSEAFSKDSLKIQMAKAARINARFVIVIGQKEALEEAVIIKDMDNGKQEKVDIKDLIVVLKKKLKETK